MANLWTPGEGLQVFAKDSNGVVVDAQTGKPIDFPNFQDDTRALAYVDDNGRRLSYTSVFPGISTVHQNVPLQDVSVKYEVDSGLFIAPVIAPVKTVDKRSNLFYVWNRGDITRDYSTGLIREPSGIASEIQQGFTTSTYTTTEYACRDFLPDKVAENADEVLELATSITQFLTTVNEMAWDRRLVTNFLTAGATFTNQTFSTAGGSTTSLYIGSATQAAPYVHNAINYANIRLIQANNGLGGTHLVMNADVAQSIAACAEIRAQVVFKEADQYVANGGWAGANYGLPNKLYGKTVVVSPLPTNTAKKGQTDSFSNLLGPTMTLLHVAAPSRRTRNAITTFRFGGIQVRTYRDEPRRGMWIEVSMDQTEVATNNYGGYTLSNALSA